MELIEIPKVKYFRVDHECYFTITKKGAFYFSKGFIKRLSISEGSTISFLKDSNNERNWYVRKGGNGNVKFHFTNNTPNHISAKNIQLEICKCLKLSPEHNYSFLIDKVFFTLNDEYYYPIINKPITI